VGVHPQLNLPRNSQDLPVRNAQVRNRLMGPRVLVPGLMTLEDHCPSTSV
jgi:hypothetical protein